MTIGGRIKVLRAELGMSQQKLANEIGVSVDTIRSLEINRANPSIETLNKLSDLFEVSSDYILGRTNFRKIEKIQPYYSWIQVHEILKSSTKYISSYEPSARDLINKKISELPPSDCTLLPTNEEKDRIDEIILLTLQNIEGFNELFTSDELEGDIIIHPKKNDEDTNY